jgi:hypothetical protein
MPSTRFQILKSLPAWAAIAVAVLACGRSPSTPSPSVTVAPGAPSAAEPTAAESSSSSGPVPFRSEVTVDDITLAVSDVLFPADEAVAQGSSLNPTPSPSAHYLFLTVTATCHPKTTGSCPLGTLRLVDSSGQIIFPILGTTGVACESPIGTFSAGDTWEICHVYEAPAEDPGLALEYKSFFGEQTLFALH